MKAELPKLVTVGSESFVHVAFSTKVYESGKVLTVHHGAPGTPEYRKYTRCLLTSIEREEIHPVNQWGHVITEQWWRYNKIEETAHRSSFFTGNDHKDGLF